MKRTTVKMLAVLAMATAFIGGTTFAQNPPATENHEAHHPEGQAPANAAAKSDEAGMMGSMKMEDMHGMMKECMENHKDGKMCEHSMMEKCQANMKKGECQKMMKDAQAKNKKEKSKK